VIETLTALALGSACGFVGAIPPGPVGLAVMRHASEDRMAAAVRSGLGGATVDTIICVAVGAGAAPTLARLASPAVRGSLSLIYVAIGLVVVVRELRRPPVEGAQPPATPRGARLSYAEGVLRGALNPSLVANWALLIAFLLANRVLSPEPASSLAFALGVGVGVASWFTVLARLIASPRSASTPPRSAYWVRRATLAGAVMVVLSGGAGVVQTLVSGAT
jgi:threonine/homoserine/homoserine lactone efflux protein